MNTFVRPFTSKLYGLIHLGLPYTLLLQLELTNSGLFQCFIIKAYLFVCKALGRGFGFWSRDQECKVLRMMKGEI